MRNDRKKTEKSLFGGQKSKKLKKKLQKLSKLKISFTIRVAQQTDQPSKKLDNFNFRNVKKDPYFGQSCVFRHVISSFISRFFVGKNIDTAKIVVIHIQTRTLLMLIHFVNADHFGDIDEFRVGLQNDIVNSVDFTSPDGGTGGVVPAMKGGRFEDFLDFRQF